jgi:hypothetical protein
MKANRRVTLERLVISAQPLEEVNDSGVARCAGRKVAEPIERRPSIAILAITLDVEVDMTGVDPVRCDGNCPEALLFDQTPRDPRSGRIKFVCAVRRLPQQDDAGIADQLHQRLIIFGGSGVNVSKIPQHGYIRR